MNKRDAEGGVPYYFPTFLLMHNVEESTVPKQWEIIDYAMPDLDKLLK
jgi:hypothetical protein